MSTTYERAGLLGVDPELWDDDDIFENYHDVEQKEENELGCCAMGCMECVGPHWSDFY